MAQNRNYSSRFEEIFSSSDLVCSGSPKIYQLRTKIQKIGSLTSVTVGEKQETKPNKTILLVGETGTGKSTLVNALFNYAVGVKFEDEIWFQVVANEDRRQTSDVIVYQIFGFENQTLPFSLTIIDTPGYGDTQDADHNNIRINQKLMELFQSADGIQEVHAVGLVMKDRENPVSDRLKYIYDFIKSQFGKDVEKNTVALMTNSQGEEPADTLEALEAANIKCAKNEKNQPAHFLFNNQQKQQRYTEKDINASKYSWDFTNEEMGHLRDFLKNTKPQPLKTTVEVLNERIRLTACIQNLKERIELNEQKQNEIKQIKEAYNKHEAEMEKNKNFTIQVDEPYKEKETISGGKWGLWFYKGAVTCDICEENCHYPGCTIAWYPSRCEVMKRGRCTVCTNKCPASDHVKKTWIYVTKTRKVQKTLNDVKEKYKQNKAECESKGSLLENLEKETSKLTGELSLLLDEAFGCVTKLEQIAMNVNSGSTLVHLDFLIKKMREKGDQEKVQVLEKLKIRMEKENESRSLLQNPGKWFKEVLNIKH
ncbi:immune-associated nucleotide-binding protein 12-like isoform X2 [Xiphophorus couchianus]|uniref:immune-associated nucleotide-binding protein 12-like isoform X2 n=1 Tax=Xiphophorus couchianus TaxID=32473 RepID=UPI001016DBC2|nr:immune-associated nucleotide-binding protein 12-like isoform X2 [Xiphophorus couchianus]